MRNDEVRGPSGGKGALPHLPGGLSARVDVLTLLRPGERVDGRVLGALDDQGCSALTHHLVEGPRAAGQSFFEAVALARNEAKANGTARYVMFLDSDVVLPRLGIQSLLLYLVYNRQFAAIGINYQAGAGGANAPHVAMGAVLFHREILERITFRTEPERCECSCCCEDIRRMGYRIGYAPGIRARHLR